MLSIHTHFWERERVTKFILGFFCLFFWGEGGLSALWKTKCYLKDLFIYFLLLFTRTFFRSVAMVSKRKGLAKVVRMKSRWCFMGGIHSQAVKLVSLCLTSPKRREKKRTKFKLQQFYLVCSEMAAPKTRFIGNVRKPSSVCHKQNK